MIKQEIWFSFSEFKPEIITQVLGIFKDDWNWIYHLTGTQYFRVTCRCNGFEDVDLKEQDSRKV